MTVLAVLSKDDQAETLQALSELPDSEWLKDCDTFDRIEHWFSLKYRYSILHKALKAYFSGEPSPLDDLAEDLQRYVRLKRDEYLSLYGLIHDGWKVITEKAEENKISLPPSPGKMLIAILQWECLGAFAIAFPENDPFVKNGVRKFSPQERYRLRNEANKLLRDLTQWEYQNYPSDQKQELEGRVRAYTERATPYLGEDRFDFWRNFCLKALSQSKGKYIKGKLKEYQRTQNELKDLICSEMNPRKRGKGYSWVNGQRLTGTNLGGVFS